jgi:hypothetical protein
MSHPVRTAGGKKAGKLIEGVNFPDNHACTLLACCSGSFWTRIFAESDLASDMKNAEPSWKSRNASGGTFVYDFYDRPIKI